MSIVQLNKDSKQERINMEKKQEEADQIFENFHSHFKVVFEPLHSKSTFSFPTN